MNGRNKDDEIFLKKLGERISTLRKEKGLSQVQFGYRLEIEKSNMNRIESGNTNPTILTLKNICQELQIDIFELFKDL
jgi:transcriptional regulator with XRE-family HTH domain